MKAETGEEIKVMKEWKGNHCGYTEPDQLIIKDEAQWRRVWKEMHRFQTPPPKPPSVDFAKEIVLAVFMGERKTGGYEIEIERLLRTEGGILIEVGEKHPPPESITTQVITQPYHLIVISKPEKTIPLQFKFKNLPQETERGK